MKGLDACRKRILVQTYPKSTHSLSAIILFFSDMTLESGLTHNLPTREPKVKQKAETPFFPAATHKYSLTIKQKMAPNSL